MSHAIVLSRAGIGLKAPLVKVEAHLSNGLPAFSVVGLPESSVRESRERVRSALICSHFKWPDRRITVSLAPAELPKSGGRFDLPIALAILVASGQLSADTVVNREFFGELGLDGALRHCRGLLSAVRAATLDQRAVILPAEQATKMALVPGSRVAAASDLLSVCGLLKSEKLVTIAVKASTPSTQRHTDTPKITGQDVAKRCLEIAAAGGHHLLMIGPPGAGKTLLAASLPPLMEDPQPSDELELSLVRDLLGLEPNRGRPFRAPHHNTTAAGLIGGGVNATPGEVSLAHGGVLFLDELPEFNRAVLDLLRQPLESGHISLNRAKGTYCYPARFQLIAAMNPCPCGFAGIQNERCRCKPDVVSRYQGRLSGPLLDRIDLHVSLERQPAAMLLQSQETDSDAQGLRGTIDKARQYQYARQHCLNAALTHTQLLQVCPMETAVRHWFEEACDHLRLSGRGIHKTLRVARSVADLAQAPSLSEVALLEAIGYRSKLLP
ncbi:MAG: YifB family Mg chelatase-like AAA ATPase [Luminiphilus sp.]|nr:YifB family Mg chelatase-like AAA ATPase [Luminiphilus sp.]